MMNGGNAALASGNILLATARNHAQISTHDIVVNNDYNRLAGCHDLPHA